MQENLSAKNNIRLDNKYKKGQEQVLGFVVGKGLIENRKMYDFPGLSLITKEDVEKYIKSNERFYKGDFDKFSLLIQKALEDKSRHVREQAVKMIQYVLESDRLSFIQKGFEDENLYVRKQAVKMIQFAPESNRALFIQRALEDEDWYVREQAVAMVRFVRELDRVSLIQKALEDKSQYVRKQAVDMIQFASESNRASFIQKAFEDEQEHVREQAVKMIQFAPESDRLLFIQRALEDKSWYVCEQAVKMIQYVPESDRLLFIQEAFEDEDWLVREQAVKMIQLASESDRVSLIQKALEDKNQYVREQAVKMIQYVPESDRLLLIQKALEGEYGSVRKEVVERVQHIDKQKQTNLKKQIGQKIKRNTRHKLEVLAQETPLYTNTQGRFLRDKFKKTGSEITLLDIVPRQEESTLKEKVIIRRIPILAYFSWKRAFEAYEYWQKKGFDYVPIEPIVKIKQHKETLQVDVFTKVIPGPTIAKWRSGGGPFQEEIQEQAERIEEGLEELGVKHGHLHRSNFVLYFHRKKNGKVDISKPPRVYVIDFDMAKSSG